MKSVLISIQPSPCELIASGIKKVEVRKTRPKRETPFKVHIYETKSSDTIFAGKPRKPVHLSFGRGMIIGEFVCDRIDEFSVPYPAYFSEIDDRTRAIIESACLTPMDIHAYNGVRQTYGWHISDLVIYDKPRELREFEKPQDYLDQSYRKRNSFFKGITRPPQSWCYVESEDTE